MAEESKNRPRHFLTGLFGFFLGAFVVLGWQACSGIMSFLPQMNILWNSHSSSSSIPSIGQNAQKDPLNELLNDTGDDPMANFEKLRQQMLKNAIQQGVSPDSDADSDFDPNSGAGAPRPEGLGAVKQREDGKFVYLDISIRGLDQQSVGVEVRDGQVILKGQVHVPSEHGESIESFNRSFPAPEHTDTKKVEIENSPDQLTLKFPKN